MNRRIVLLDREGLHSIEGLDDEFQNELPTFVDPLPIRGRVSSGSLIKATNRYVLYKETIAPSEPEEDVL